MPTTRELHLRAMELMDEALISAETTPRIENLLKQALGFEASAADSVANRLDLEPTRSVLHRGAASLALRVGDVQTAKRYINVGLQGQPPSEIRQELDEILGQVLMREALTTSYKLKPPKGKTLVKETIDRFTENIPVDIKGLAEALGLSVSVAPLGTNRGVIERNLKRGGFSGYQILVNEDDPREVRRVAVGHEISHFLKDRDRFTDRLIDGPMYSSGLAIDIEELADKVALDFLIPGKHLARLRKEIGDNVEELARIFRVPLTEMKIRMGIIGRRVRL